MGQSLVSSSHCLVFPFSHCLVITQLPLPDSVRIEVVEEGDEVALRLRPGVQMNDIISLDLQWDLDTTQLKFLSAQPGEDTPSGTLMEATTEAGQLRVSMANWEPYHNGASAPILELKFRRVSTPAGASLESKDVFQNLLSTT